MTPIIKKDNTETSGKRPPRPKKDTKPAAKEAKPAGEVDYAAMLEPLTEKEKPKSRGRGPGPAYEGLINAFREADARKPGTEYKIRIDVFRTALGKPDLKVASIRQGLRNRLHARELFDEIQVSIYADREFPEDPEKSMLTLKRRPIKGNRD